MGVRSNNIRFLCKVFYYICEGTTINPITIMETIDNNFNYEECEKNIRQQKDFFAKYLREHNKETLFPMDCWARGEFWGRYWYFRACVASLLSNPDTKDDKDFLDLCNYWRGLVSPFNLSQENFDELEKKYRRLQEKPAFACNPFYENLFGAFVKGIYGLIAGACPDYWSGFFELD